ncbi:hypothetical protein K438DRAFT_1483955, partial [Mycena galopus ATCC 62051]
VNDSLSRGWTIPVPNKHTAFSHLHAWTLAIETKTGNKFGTFIINTRELKSTEFEKWYAECSTEISYTLPHVSKMNGKVERYHLTIHSKGCAMRTYCNTPAFLWDEFCAQALCSLYSGFVFRICPQMAIACGCMPFECFEGVKLNIAHLSEIGCRAFILIEGNNLKVYDRSFECVLISYTPHSKSYQGWKCSTGKVYDSINICF